MREEAVLMTRLNPSTGLSPSAEDGKVAKVLGFFGVPWRTLITADFPTRFASDRAGIGKSRLLCSAEVLLRLIEGLERDPDRMQFWRERVHSAFVYAGDDAGVWQKLIRILTGDDSAVLQELNPGAKDLVVSDQWNDFCRVMAGVRVTASRSNIAGALVLHTTKAEAVKIISVDRGATFLKLEHESVPIFLSTSKNIIDMEAEVAARNFDIREHFLSAVPIVLYIRWAFPDTCWNASEANACLVIDDPVLKPAYGFVNFHELLSVMERHKFSTNIAFIPWNWRRSAPEVVRLFKENPEKFSLSVHGCDHTGGEFGSRDGRLLAHKAKQATERMRLHESETGIRHDKVMVFPQGIFSDAALDVLKHNSFIAAVNTEVISADPKPRKINISALWDIAVMDYGGFPIFTRRYPSQGIENLAFDILLGKPCIVVIKHDFCREQYTHLVEFISRLNELKYPLSWRSLGDVVRRSCRQRQLSSEVVEIEMYGTELRIENRFEQRKQFSIRRRESAPSAIRDVSAGFGKIPWKFSGGYVRFEIDLNPGHSATVGITFHDLGENGQSSEDICYKLKTSLRRYLSEVRDNYVLTRKSRFSGLFERP